MRDHLHIYTMALLPAMDPPMNCSASSNLFSVTVSAVWAVMIWWTKVAQGFVQTHVDTQ